MPKIVGGELAKRKPFFTGLEGTITAAEQSKTQVKSWDGIRCVVKDDKGEEFSEMLWVRGEMGPKSKLGAFMKELSDNTDLWIGKRVIITRWKEGDREISVLPSKKPKAEGK